MQQFRHPPNVSPENISPGLTAFGSFSSGGSAKKKDADCPLSNRRHRARTTKTAPSRVGSRQAEVGESIGSNIKVVSKFG